jgi:hypothetical protein
VVPESWNAKLVPAEGGGDEAHTVAASSSSLSVSALRVAEVAPERTVPSGEEASARNAPRTELNSKVAAPGVLASAGERGMALMSLCDGGLCDGGIEPLIEPLNPAIPFATPS